MRKINGNNNNTVRVLAVDVVPLLKESIQYPGKFEVRDTNDLGRFVASLGIKPQDFVKTEIVEGILYIFSYKFIIYKQEKSSDLLPN